MTYFVHCDFEFNDSTLIVGCFLDSSGKHAFDLRNNAGIVALKEYITARPNHVFCAYAAEAEITCLLRLGVDEATLERMRWVDLMAECNMICGTRPDYWVPAKGLHHHLRVFGIEPLGNDKEEMRELILSKGHFTDDEYARIAAYCWTDVDALPALLVKLTTFHNAFRARSGHDTWCLNYAEFRGHYVKACAVLAHRSKGLPINVPLFNDLHEHREAVKGRLATLCNERYGHPLYVYNERANRFSFSMKGLKAYLESTPFYAAWRRTKTGQLRTDSDYLDEVVSRFPELKDFRRTRETLAHLNTDLFSCLRNGFIKPGSIPFWTKTGRNQPKVKDGFILNAPPWLRHVVRPEQGRKLIAADWAKQEIGIAVALSGDRKLRTAYEGRDIYLAIAEMAGAINTGMTSAQVKQTRQTFKSVQLGLGYGMAPDALALSIYNDVRASGGDITKEAAQADAERIFAWHKRTFTQYWAYLHDEADRARRNGFTVSADGWVYFADEKTKHTQLLNVPMQSNGAAMLRRAMIELAFRTKLNVVCSLHDAIYIYCANKDAEDHYEILREVMDRAVKAVVGPGTAIHIGRSDYSHDSGYDAALDLQLEGYKAGEIVTWLS